MRAATHREMARRASTALAGYFPTPSHLVTRIASLVDVAWATAGYTFAVADPCAGDGAAVMDAITSRWWAGAADSVGLAAARKRTWFYGCELEKLRARALADRAAVALRGALTSVAHADALRLDVGQTAGCPTGSTREGASILWGNPPYDVDSVYGRLEERFLRAWAPRVAEGGALLWIVPAASLEASADTFARHFTDLHCYRFPKEDYAAFKQVVVVGRARHALASPDSLVRLQCQLWARDPASILELPERPRAHVVVAPSGSAGFSKWERAPLDVAAMVAAHAPWSETPRGGGAGVAAPVLVEGVLPPNAANLLRADFPVVVPPRASHIAAALAAGAYSGAEIVPDAGRDGGATTLPRALIKATFDREHVPIEEKRARDGKVNGVLEVQAPRLRITALDLSTYRYHTLKTEVAASGAETLEGFTAGDLLARYGRSLLDVLRERCPVLHDPQRTEDAIPLPPMRRTLYRAQAHAAMACLKVLERGNGDRPVLLGEIGAGKSSVVAQVAAARGARSLLILCPPHLLDGWRGQLQAVYGDVVPYRAFVLGTIDDVEAYAAWRRDPSYRGFMGVAILSRERAKLGHAWESVLTARCPSCGAPLGPEKSEGERARRRLTCTAPLGRGPANEVARIAERLAVALAPAFGADADVLNTIPRGLREKIDRVWPARAKGPEAAQAARVEAAARRPAIGACASDLFDLLRRHGRSMHHEASSVLRNALFVLVLGAGGDEVALTIAEGFASTPWPAGGATVEATAARDSHASVWLEALGLLLLVRHPSLAERVERAARAMEEAATAAKQYHTADGRRAWWHKRDVLLGKASPVAGSDPWYYLKRTAGGGLLFSGSERDSSKQVVLGDPKGLLRALAEMNRCALWEGAGDDAPKCGAPLFQAEPSLKRVPLATYIARRQAKLFDFLVADEAHELSSEESAQGRSATRLMGAIRDAVSLTGSSSNGYASSLFTLLWNSSRAFRREFRRDQEGKFVARYGLTKRLVQQVDSEGKVVEFGTHSDRVQTKMADKGEAPGVLPPLVLRHVLPIAVTLQKADLALELPPHEEIVVYVQPSTELAARHMALVERVIAQVRKDTFTPLAGKLLGAVARLPSHADRATAECGNWRDDDGAEGGTTHQRKGVDPGSYVVAYPPTALWAAGSIVAVAAPLPDDELLPKELKLVELVRQELAEGRRVMVLGYHTPVLPRLQRILRAALGEPVAFLDAKKVAPAKREAWINREVVDRGVRVLVVNPVAVQTGLNNLVWFATQVWVENPNCNPVVYDQASGRIDRIGKTLPTRAYFLVYELPTQRALHRLLMHKAGVLRGVDGLDAESALVAAGAGSDLAFAGMGLGRELYAMLTAGD